MCLRVHVDTVLLCLKHHFQFQQQEWKAMSSSDTFLFPDTIDSKHHPKWGTQILLYTASFSYKSLSLLSLSPLANKKKSKKQK